MRQFTKKICEIPQEQYEDPELKLLREKACNAVSCNNAGVEGLLRAVTAFGTGVLGLFVYMVIAGFIHPVILLLLFGLSVIGALCNSLPDWYENKIRDENARDEMTMQYIDRLSDDAISGKDIRVFGLKKW
jgi:ATP-binding cassette, subfamily B, bacterial